MTSYIHQLSADVIEPICQATFPFMQPRSCTVCFCPLDGMMCITEAILLRKNYEKVVTRICCKETSQNVLFIWLSAESTSDHWITKQALSRLIALAGPGKLKLLFVAIIVTLHF